MMGMSKTDTRQESGAQPKKPYTQPTLTEYGSVSKLTMIKGSTNVEGGAPFSKKQNCL